MMIGRYAKLGWIGGYLDDLLIIGSLFTIFAGNIVPNLCWGRLVDCLWHVAMTLEDSRAQERRLWLMERIGLDY
jgi:hypothetical protein